METATDIARRICPNWMSPTGDAHYQNVKRELERLIEDRALLVSAIDEVLKSATPNAKEHPAMFAAWSAAKAALSSECGVDAQDDLFKPHETDKRSSESIG